MRNNPRVGTSFQALNDKLNVMRAVVLRDMRTRFFNHGLGFLVVSIWPLVHMVALLAINTAAGRQTPFGDSLLVFLATGLVPTLAFMYVSRFMALSLILNRPMMSFPIVTMLDIIAARAFLEIIAAFVTLVAIITILCSLGENPFPYDIPQAVMAYLATLLLAVGIGSLAGVITMFFDFFVTIYVLLMIVVYISSGTLFVANQLPDYIAIPLSWNPVLQCVEWLRTAYFETYSDRLVSKPYLVGCGISTLALGLLLERVLRGKMLEG